MMSEFDKKSHCLTSRLRKVYSDFVELQMRENYLTTKIIFTVVKGDGKNIDVPVDKPGYPIKTADDFFGAYEEAIIDGVLSTLPYMDKKVRMMNL